MTASKTGLWEGLVLFCAANPFDGIKLADQHFAENLSRLTPVLYVDPPLSRLTPLRNSEATRSLKGPKLRIEAPGLAHLTPVVQPGPSRRGMTSLTSALTRRHIRNAVVQLDTQVWTVISAWPQYSVFGSCKEEVSVYWAQDDFVGGAALLGMSARVLNTREGRIAAAADFVVAANPLVADVWRGRNHEVVLIPYGTDVDAYAEVDRAPPPPDVQLPAPVVGFVGQINDRMDMRLLEAIAERGRSLLLIGPRNPAFEPIRFDTLLRRRNVCWVGPKPFEALPSYLRLIDVGIVPYCDSPFNRGSFPLKTLEYLAAGRGVVTTDLPAIRWLSTDLVAIASDPQSFSSHVDRMLAETRSPTLMAHRRAFAAQHSWANCAARFHEAMLSRSHSTGRGARILSQRVR